MRLISLSPTRRSASNSRRNQPLGSSFIFRQYSAIFPLVLKEKLSRLVDWKDVQVNIRTKSTIQLELALAKVVSLFQGAEVEEAEVNRFFYFENERRGDEDPRNVGLPQQHPPRLVGIGSRRFQEIDQLSGSFRSLESD